MAWDERKSLARKGSDYEIGRSGTALRSNPIELAIRRSLPSSYDQHARKNRNIFRGIGGSCRVQNIVASVFNESRQLVGPIPTPRIIHAQVEQSSGLACESSVRRQNLPIAAVPRLLDTERETAHDILPVVFWNCRWEKPNEICDLPGIV